MTFEGIISIFTTAVWIINSQLYTCMITNVISYFMPKELWCLKLISWKHSFNRLNEEYEMAKKKKQALDNLFEKGKISQSTRDSFINEIAVAIAEIEKQQQDLIQKMQSKAGELENQIKTLEMLLANYEIQHVTGEIDENTYQLEINLLSNGLESSRNELGNIKEATKQLCSPIIQEAVIEPVAPPLVEVESPLSVENVEFEVTPTETAEMPVVTEPVIEETFEAPEFAASPEIESAPVIEETLAEEQIPVMEQTNEAEENFEASITEETTQEIAEMAEEDNSENLTENIQVEATEPVIEEDVVTENVSFEQTDFETDATETEVIQEDERSSIVKEIVLENPCIAPEAPQTEDAEGAQEVCAEMPQALTPSVKETISLVETSDSEETDEE